MKTKNFKNGVQYKGEFLKDKKHGWGQQVWPDKRSYEGMFKEDLMNGTGRYVWPEGKVYFGDFQSDIMTGNGILIENKYKVMFGEFENSQLQGKGVMFLEDDKQLQIKVGRSWNMGLLPNGFKIDINNNNPNIATVVQYINNNIFEWIPKDEIKKYEEQIKLLRAEVLKDKKTSKVEDDPKSRSQFESFRQEINDHQREIRESLENKAGLEVKIIETLQKQKQLQTELIKKMMENEKRLKDENDSLRNGVPSPNADFELQKKYQNAQHEIATLKESVEKMSNLEQLMIESRSKSEEMEKMMHQKEQEHVKAVDQLKKENEELKKRLADPSSHDAPQPKDEPTDPSEMLENVQKREKDAAEREESLKKKEEEIKKREEELTKREEEFNKKEEENKKKEEDNSKTKTPRLGITPRGETEQPSWKDRLKKFETKPESKPILEVKEGGVVDFRSVLKKTDPQPSPNKSAPLEPKTLSRSPSMIKNDQLKLSSQNLSPDTSRTNSQDPSPRLDDPQPTPKELVKKPSVVDLRNRFSQK